MLTSQEKIEIVLQRLNGEERRQATEALGNLNDLDQTDLQNLELASTSLYLEMNKFRVYQLFTAEVTFEKLFEHYLSVDDVIDVLAGDEDDAQSIIKSGSTTNTFSVSFGKIETVTVPKVNGQGQRVTGEFDTKKLFYIFEATFMKLTDDKIIISLKFPSLVREANKPYHYVAETNFFIQWCSTNLTLPLIPVPLKAFFQELQNATGYDKTGFTAYDLKGPNAVVNATISIDAGKNSTSANSNATIDEIIQPQVAAYLTDQIRPALQSLGLSPVQIAGTQSALVQTSLCEAYFAYVHEACLYGRGKVKFDSGTTKIHYTLEYEKNRFNLIRVLTEGWEEFEPIFNEIKIFIN